MGGQLSGGQLSGGQLSGGQLSGGQLSGGQLSRYRYLGLLVGTAVFKGEKPLLILPWSWWIEVWYFSLILFYRGPGGLRFGTSALFYLTVPTVVLVD